MLRKVLYLVCLCCISLFFFASAQSRKENPTKYRVKGCLLWDLSDIDSIKNSEIDRQSFLILAEEELTKPNIVVTDKKQSLTGNKHNYESLSSYYWPDPNNLRGPYINKDGLVNPETLDYDREKIDKMAERCKTLSIAYYMTGDNRFYNAFVGQVKSWFLARSTKMIPNMNYSQVIKGKYNNKGQAHGIIDAYSFATVLESIRLLETRKPLSCKISKGMKQWFSQFAKWLKNSEQGKIESKQPNNHSPIYYALLSNISLYTGDYKMVQFITNIYPETVLARLIEKDGSQPGELVRTRAFHYSILSLASIVDYCAIMENVSVHFYAANQDAIDRAFNYLIQYKNNKSLFPATEIGDWKTETEYLDKQIVRLCKVDNKAKALMQK